jgi:uncharacterized pyridoxal phosphate-containing UPF0001 family protein
MAEVALSDSERSAQLLEALVDVRSRIQRTVGDRNPGPLLVAVSKLHSASDILTCHQHGQLDFGENYVQELEDKSLRVRSQVCSV